MKLVLLAVTGNGKKLAQKISHAWPERLPIFVQKKLADETATAFPKETFQENMAFFFQNYDGLICIMATGIVVRGISRVIDDKRSDPAVIVMDEKGKNVISLLSGHLGGGNQLTREVATLLNSNPVITTATDTQNVTALDILAKEIQAWYPDFKKNTKWINGLLADHQKVGLIQEKKLVKDKRGLTEIEKEADTKDFAAVLVISDKADIALEKNWIPIVPRRYALGIGCKKNTAAEVIKNEFLNFCRQQKLHPFCVRQIVSIDLKKAETGILALADWLEVSFKTFSAEELATVAEKYPQSNFVKKTTGVGSVALAAADLASGGQVVTERYANNGVTFALGRQAE